MCGLCISQIMSRDNVCESKFFYLSLFLLLAWEPRL